MKKIILSMFIFTFLFADNKSLYKSALIFYKNKKYEMAYKMFNKLLQTNYKSENYNFYFGMSAEKLKKYAQAIAAFERILIYSPDNRRAKLELAKLYFLTKNYKLSKQYFLELKERIKNKQVLKNINKLLKQIYLYEKKHTYKTALIIGSGYDNNIYNKADNEYLDFSIGKVKNTTPQKSGYFFKNILSFKHKYKGFKYKYTDNIIVFNKTYPKAGDSNLFLFKYSPIFNRSYYTIYPFFSYIKSGGKSYMKIYGLSYGFKKNYYKGEIKYQIKDYLTKDNAESIELNNNFFHSTSVYNNLNFLLSFQFQKNRSGNDPSLKFRTIKTKLYNNYMFEKYIFSINGGVSWTKYLIENPLYNKKQFDKKLEIAGNITRKFNNFLLSLNMQYLKNISNFDIYEYNKYITEMSVIIPLKGK